ncbi:Gfo/Idh/MocA family oxidoreductase [Evansella sp. AB-P1]|uniref:Gfo/Idh/MocA family protein n=1 Tax=Evansella sp. AB-P1 TaxID=3037653 RepID=UPI00241D4C40|nr:Gfo/Idh/MocA family oxidoreductase [Evansella sp. AB-P1]MDG5788589.1 Gfo/Idh/MocA family oxidoreductase [Evansella sp. AB-P1]
MPKIHIGIIGLGAIGERLISSFQQRDDVIISAICDISEARLEEIAAMYNVNQSYVDYTELLNNEDIDAVYVAVPPKFHEKVVLEAVKANKHILCEKPLANSVAEAKNMVDVVKNSPHIVHGMHFPLNYQESIVHFEKLIQDGFIGDLRRINLRMHFPHWPRLWQQTDWVASREQGGFILEVGVHWIQLIQRVFGKIKSVKSKLQFPNDPKACENSIVAEMMLENGTIILIDGISDIAGEEELIFATYGTKGTLQVKNWRDLLGGEKGDPLMKIKPNTLERSSMIDEFVRAVQGHDAELYDFSVGYEAQVVLEALRHPMHDDWLELKY